MLAERKAGVRNIVDVRAFTAARRAAGDTKGTAAIPAGVSGGASFASTRAATSATRGYDDPAARSGVRSILEGP